MTTERIKCVRCINCKGDGSRWMFNPEIGRAELMDCIVCFGTGWVSEDQLERDRNMGAEYLQRRLVEVA